MMMMIKMMVNQAKAQDKLFLESGEEEETLNSSITKHDL